MGYGHLPSPGTKYGPCTGACEHRDCALTRSQAASACPHCGKPIGYDVAFYSTHDVSVGTLPLVDAAGASYGLMHVECAVRHAGR